MSLRNLNHWINRASQRDYHGPIEGAVLLIDGSVHLLPNLRDYAGCRAILNGIAPEKVAATFTKAPKGGWGGEASVRCATGGLQNLYVSNGGNDLDATVATMCSKLVDHNSYVMSLDKDPVAKLDLLLRTHDWYSAYSDAPGVALAGDRAWDRIVDLMKQVSANEAQALFAKYAPEDAVCPV